MKVAIVSLSEITKGNTRMCLSAKRALKLCWQCKLYPTCESRIINVAFDKDNKRIQKLNVDHQEKLDNIKSRWNC